MFLRSFTAVAMLALIPSCKDRDEVVVSETRRATERDLRYEVLAAEHRTAWMAGREPSRLFSSDERFRNTRPSPVIGTPPADWLPIPATEFRLLNYRFGQGGEVWVSEASGGVLDNINRWLGQFDRPPLYDSGLEQLEKLPMAGGQGFWIEAEGVYAAGMGKQPVPGQAMAGVIVAAGDRVLTLKMVGPAAEVETQKAVLKAFAATLEWRKQ